MKPSPNNIQELYLDSLRALGIDPLKHDIRFVEDNWENPTLGCAGLGWEVWLDGMEITQFTYFQQVGGMEANPVSAEITYGLERLATYIQGKENVFDLEWLKVLRMEIYFFSQSLNILRIHLKYQILTCCSLYLPHMRKKLGERLKNNLYFLHTIIY